jgi:hypothetical protein
MRIRLTRKLAQYLDGIDVSANQVGDVLDLPRREAELLIAERWAEAYFESVKGPARSPDRADQQAPSVTAALRSNPADGTAVSRRLNTIERLRHIRQQIEQQHVREQQRRRAEDEIREELHDARAKTVGTEETIGTDEPR